MSKYSSKDIEEMIERQKSLMDVELNDIRKKHSAIISDLEQQLKDAKEVEAKQAFIDSLVFKTDEWGRQYRVATQKMLDFADTIEHSCFSCWELNQEHTDIINEKKTIEQFAIEKNLPEDSFELIRDYISTFKPIMVRIQSINKSHYLEERKRYAELVYRNSPGMRVTFVKKGDLKTNVRGKRMLWKGVWFEHLGQSTAMYKNGLLLECCKTIMQIVVCHRMETTTMTVVLQHIPNTI